VILANHNMVRTGNIIDLTGAILRQSLSSSQHTVALSLQDEKEASKTGPNG
jgi:hypothetical protein